MQNLHLAEQLVSVSKEDVTTLTKQFKGKNISIEILIIKLPDGSFSHHLNLAV